MKQELTRRSLLKISSLIGLDTGLAGLIGNSPIDIQEVIEDVADEPEQKGSSVIGLRDDPISPVNTGIIGLGNRGGGMARQVNAMCPEKAEIKAICDVREERVDSVLEYLRNNGGQDPDTYSGSEDAWKDLADRGDLDLVLVFTNWNQHVPMSVYSMQQDKHVAMEVPAAYTVEGCWKLVNTAERMQKHCMMLENVCYGSEELWLLNMAREGVLGELTYAEASYIHNLRSYLFGNAYWKKWRIRHHVERDGNLYPTHGLGPVAQYLDIQRGDRFEYLVSVSSPQASLEEHSKSVDSSNEFHDRDDFAHGDMNNSLIKTDKGRSILVQHDVVTPRPYSRTNALAGTKGYHEGYPSRLSLQKKGHRWLNDEEYDEYRTKYEHPIRKELSEEIEKYGGHGGMDFVLLYRLFDNLNKGRPLDMDVYDGAAWSVVSPLSEISVELDGTPVKFPDFTRGKWKKKRKLNMIKQF